MFDIILIKVLIILCLSNYAYPNSIGVWMVLGTWLTSLNLVCLFLLFHHPSSISRQNDIILYNKLVTRWRIGTPFMKIPEVVLFEYFRVV